jgi:hypothetical protein
MNIRQMLPLSYPPADHKKADAPAQSALEAHKTPAVQQIQGQKKKPWTMR